MDDAKSVRDLAAGNGYAVTWSDTKPPKLQLPPIPDHDDGAGLTAWLTAVLNLDQAHPITGATLHGAQRRGRVELRRAGAPTLAFEPASVMTAPAKLIDVLVWQLQRTDGRPFGYRNEHARDIAYVVRLLCDAARAMTDEQETLNIVGTFQMAAVAVEGFTTYGTSPQRYEAADALRRETDANGRPVSPPRYLIEKSTGEFVIRASDLTRAAREYVGSTVPHGWLDGRMEAVGWERVTLDGHAIPGREGRAAGGGHLCVSAYRGHVPGVTT